MAKEHINPIEFAHQVNDQFLNYQLTAFPLTDPDLAQQARALLRDRMGKSPLVKGPYVSLAKPFKFGTDLKELADKGTVHRALPGLTEYHKLFAHQENTLQEVLKGNHCLIATGTGSGKTEAFLFPILDHCLKLRDSGAPDGIVAILVYPMNALAYDQLDRLRRMLVGSGISFGMYIGTTPASESDFKKGSVVRMKSGEGIRERWKYEEKYKDHERIVISPAEERLTEREMAEKPPRLLLTNVNQLELLLTRGKDLGMFMNAPLKYLVFDEAHTYSGAVGAEVACLIRRLKAFCGKDADEVICIGTSATIADPEKGEEAGVEFAHRFFGVDPKRVSLVKEEYQEEEFPKDRINPSIPTVDTIDLLKRTLKGLESESEADIGNILRDLTGQELTPGSSWREALFDLFRLNQYVYALFHSLSKPMELAEAVQQVWNAVGRGLVTPDIKHEAELLCYLALGAVAEKSSNPLLRPKVHYFIKGLEGAVVSFDKTDKPDEFRPILSLSLKDAKLKSGAQDKACPPMLVCKNCGQHYFEGHYKELFLENGDPGGGNAEGDNVIWEPSDDLTGQRIIFTNNFISETDETSEQATERLDRKRTQLYFCRLCGTLHRHPRDCRNAKCKAVRSLVPIWLVATTEEGKLITCPCCGQRGRTIGSRVIEPIRPLRAVTVADVHILSQSMINSVTPDQQKLIVFSDNRQDAAFQAGWMQDHARRYRLRHLIYEYLRDLTEPCSISDVQQYLLKRFRQEKDLGYSLAPEVYADRTQDYFGTSLDKTLAYYLRIVLVRELATGFKQRDSLETWGMMRVLYAEVNPENKWIKTWSERLAIATEDLSDGISALLDSYRRGRYLFDKLAPIFSRYWHEGDPEVQQGFVPFFADPKGNPLPPQGLKEQRENQDSDRHVTQFRSVRGQTLAMDAVSKWGVGEDLRDEFLSDLWNFVTRQTRVLVPVTLTGRRGRALPGSAGTYQVDSQRVGILAQSVRYRCTTCQRIHTRNTPSSACMAWRCRGTLNQETPPVDDYNIQLLGLPFSMVKPREHSAQVPAKLREDMEDEFKKKGGRINCLVCTPTLELGVDIGDLDMILMRNVPPKPSNYWQRAGRGGRRFRMGVNYTYCRRSQHDAYFFDDPLSMLSGFIETPRFHMKNEVMVKKHVHAAIISEITRMARMPQESSGLSDADLREVQEIKQQVFPDYVVSYLFEDGRHYRRNPFDVTSLNTIISKHKNELSDGVTRIFETYWPERDREVASETAIGQYVDQMTDELQRIIDRLHQRLIWAVHTQNRLLRAQRERLLELEEERLLTRCKQYIQRQTAKEMSTYALSVLATEGFLPGYGIYAGGIRAFAVRGPGYVGERMDFELPRPASIAIREFVPGNLIYANNWRFRTTLFHLPVGENIQLETYTVDLDNKCIEEAAVQNSSNSQYNSGRRMNLQGLPICDVDISRISRISDEEQYRFQLPVTIFGYLKRSHRGGTTYSIGNREFHHITGQHIRLVNVGPVDRVSRGELGYPICSVCGAVRSPYASQREMEHFIQIHTKRCGRAPVRAGFSTDASVDGFVFHDFDSQADAINLAEAIRRGASQILEMDTEDLQILLVAQPEGKHTLFLYDPMPGGSGLLQQIIEKWENMIEVSRESLGNCPTGCDKSCYECLRSYRNAYYHPLLDRHVALGLLTTFSDSPKFERDVPPVAETQVSEGGQPTNVGERRLESILNQAGFPEFTKQKRIHIGPPYNNTYPDLHFEDPASNVKVAIYLDGLSEEIHGSEERARIDRIIREQLEAMGIDVIEIASSDLNDPQATKRHLKRIAAKLKRPDLTSEVNNRSEPEK